MPYKEKLVIKKYFTISEVVSLLEEVTGYRLAGSKLRFWEKELDLNIARQTSSKKRKYTQEDVELFRIIITLNNKYGLTASSIQVLLHSRELRARLGTFLLEEYFEFKALRNGT